MVAIEPVTPEGNRLWAMTLSLASDLGPDREWSLIGGLMVQLHGFEREDDFRPTTDIDLLGAARKPPPMTEQIASLLVEKGAEVATPPRTTPELGYRFELNGELVEILGPDGLRADPHTTAGLKTFGVSGGSQALARTEVVLVSLAGAPPVAVRRPSLLGAILIKARVVAKRRKEKFQSDRQDLIRLLSYVDDPRALAREDQLKSSERRWLRNVERALDFDDPALAAAFPSDTLGRARQAFRLLSRP
ncbi:MAG TPA: hypothetical protein VGB06_06925 [Solirubrobacterales bacterium]